MSTDILSIMENSNTIVLFDIDHTLFDTASYQQACYQKIFSLINFSDKDAFFAACNVIYKEQRTHGSFFRKEFIDSLCERLGLTADKEKLVEVFADESILDGSVYPDADEVITSLTDRKILIGIFSAGPHGLQRAKIKSLLNHFSEEHIYIHEIDKKQNIPLIVDTYKDYRVFAIDDLVDVLYSLKSESKNIMTILIKREDWHNRAKIAPSDFRSDFEIRSLKELDQIIK